MGNITTPVGTGVTVPVTGLAATGSVGAATGLTNVVISVTGLAATGSGGAVTTQSDNNISVTSPAAMVSGVGSITMTGAATVSVTGVEASGQVEPVLVWGRIIPGATTVWTEIAA